MAFTTIALKSTNSYLLTWSINNRFTQLRGVVNYMCNVIFNQGGYCSSKKLAIRWITGAWCLFAFVLVTPYQSVLISYILAPIILPLLINGAKDLAARTEVGLVVDKGLGLDLMLSVINYYNICLSY